MIRVTPHLLVASKAVVWASLRGYTRLVGLCTGRQTHAAKSRRLRVGGEKGKKEKKNRKIFLGP